MEVALKSNWKSEQSAQRVVRKSSNVKANIAHLCEADKGSRFYYRTRPVCSDGARGGDHDILERG